LPVPLFATLQDYGERLGDAAFWAPSVAEALARHGLPQGKPEAGRLGTFPTFLVGSYVVKFFGERFSGGVCHEIERSLHRRFLLHPEIPAPSLIAEGALSREGWPWPYLITSRMAGSAWRHVALQPVEQERLAVQIGTIVRSVHDLPPPDGPFWQRDPLADLRADCSARHRQWGTLPRRLVDHIDRFLVEASPVRRLVHADLHADHLFVDGGRLVGIIDWGDVLLTDPYYELPALHLGTFGGSKRLLKAFLDGYEWEVGADFSRRAMTMTLLHQFNVLGDSASVDMREVDSLDDLADLLWDVS